MENMKSMTEGGGSTPMVSIGQLSSEINDNHPDITAQKEWKGQMRAFGMTRVISGAITHVKQPSI